jgi:hypothetical protein
LNNQGSVGLTMPRAFVSGVSLDHTFKNQAKRLFN